MSTIWICGVDEAGRGPLVGAVVAGAVVLDPQQPIVGLKDSKKVKLCQAGNPLYGDFVKGKGLGHWRSISPGDRSVQYLASDHVSHATSDTVSS